MITGITIENFKSIRDRMDLDLRPITLLFGENSAGKSIINVALNYLQAVLAEESATPESRSDSGIADFISVVHNHDPDRKITLGITCAISAEDHGYFQILSHTDNENDEWGAPALYDPHLDEELESLSIEVTLESTYADIDGGLVRTAFVSKIAIGFNGSPLATIEPSRRIRGKLIGFLWRVNLGGVLPAADKEPKEITFTCYNRTIFPKDRDPPLSIGFYLAEGDDQEIPSPTVATHLNTFVLAAFQIARWRLKQRRTVGSIRIVPNDSFMPRSLYSASRWTDGSGAWDFLSYCGEDALIDVNCWLVKLGVGYAIVQQLLVDLRKVLSLSKAWHTDLEKRQREILNLKLGARHFLRLARATTEKEAAKICVYPESVSPLLSPEEVGVGVSQIVPVVAAALERTKVLNSIMQPELHLHPKVQAELGDLFISSMHEHSQRFLIETHSEHLILRLCRRVRETEIAKVSKDLKLRTDDLAIYVVKQQDGATTFNKIDVDVRGEFIQPWPDDFFEIDFYERFPDAR